MVQVLLSQVVIHMASAYESTMLSLLHKFKQKNVCIIKELIQLEMTCPPDKIFEFIVQKFLFSPSAELSAFQIQLEINKFCAKK